MIRRLDHSISFPSDAVIFIQSRGPSQICSQSEPAIIYRRESAGAHNSHNSLCLKTRGYIIRIIDKGKAKGVKSALESEWIQFLFLYIKIK